jgi:hypothetical protein
LFFYCSELQALDGFGSVFDGVFKGGQFENISTQAVMDLFKNVDCSGDKSSEFVQIGSEDLIQYNIPRVEENANLQIVGKFIFDYFRL